MDTSNNLPQFPTFRPLEAHDSEVFSTYNPNLPPYSDTNFISLISWDIKDSCQISILNSNIIILFQDYLTLKFCLTIVGDNLPNETIEAANDFIEKIPYNAGLKYIPEYLAKKIDITKWRVIETESSHDYILSVSKLIEMHKWRNSSIPNSIKRFLKSNPNFKFIITPNIEVNWDVYLSIFEHWLHNNEFDIWSNNEYKAFQRFTRLKYKSLLTFSILVDDELMAFDCCELIDEKYAIAHFSKAKKSIKGIYEILQWYTAKFLADNRCEYINIEQDLGLEGLRFSKLKYKPVGFFKKFIIKSRYNLPAGSSVPLEPFRWSASR